MSVGLPSWHELIDHMKRELGLEDMPHQSGWSYQTLSEYYRLKNGSIGPLRSWMDRTWSVCSDKVRESEIHEIIVDLDFPLVYTTNYDNNLEIAYQAHGREFVKVANTSDIVNAERGLPQIVKFHGDFDDDESLVLAETDYFRRLAFDSRSTSSSRPTRWAARCCSWATACRTSTSACCSTGCGRCGRNRDESAIGRRPSCSPQAGSGAADGAEPVGYPRAARKGGRSIGGHAQVPAEAARCGQERDRGGTKIAVVHCPEK
ncbi:SIR2 family protein [Novosphingobium resinovorum]